MQVYFKYLFIYSFVTPHWMCRTRLFAGWISGVRRNVPVTDQHQNGKDGLCIEVQQLEVQELRLDPCLCLLWAFQRRTHRSVVMIFNEIFRYIDIQNSTGMPKRCLVEATKAVRCPWPWSRPWPDYCDIQN